LYDGLVGRYLCSELVKLSSGLTVNLEEIWEEGAAIESDDELRVGDAIELKCGDHTFAGTVTLAMKHEFGYRVEMDFATGIRWTPGSFRPQHILDPQELAAKKVEN
jgi:hypothetical protein